MSSAPIIPIIDIGVGVDLSGALIGLAHHRGRSFNVLYGRGMVEQVMLRQSTGRIVTHEGSFEMISMAGTIIPSSTLNSAGELEIYLSNTTYGVIGGTVISPLVASSHVLLIVVSVPYTAL